MWHYWSSYEFSIHPNHFTRTPACRVHECKYSTLKIWFSVIIYYIQALKKKKKLSLHIIQPLLFIRQKALYAKQTIDLIQKLSACVSLQTLYEKKQLCSHNQFLSLTQMYFKNSVSFTTPLLLAHVIVLQSYSDRVSLLQSLSIHYEWMPMLLRLEVLLTSDGNELVSSRPMWIELFLMDSETSSQSFKIRLSHPAACMWKYQF